MHNKCIKIIAGSVVNSAVVARFDHKLSVIDEIANGQISVNHASKKHRISRSTIDYWMKN